MRRGECRVFTYQLAGDVHQVRHSSAAHRSVAVEVVTCFNTDGSADVAIVHRHLRGFVRVVRQHDHRARISRGNGRQLVVGLPARLLRAPKLYGVVVQPRRHHLPEPEQRFLV